MTTEELLAKLAVAVKEVDKSERVVVRFLAADGRTWALPVEFIAVDEGRIVLDIPPEVDW